MPPSPLPTASTIQRLIAAGSLGEAGALLKTAIASAPRQPEFRRLAGDLLVALGRTGDARQAYEDALSLAPSDAPSRARLARLHLLQGDPAKAVSVTGTPADTEGLSVLAAALNQLERPSEAADAAAAARSRHPTHLAACLEHGRALNMLRQHEDALAALDSPASENAPAALWGEKGWALIGLDRMEDAEAAFRKALGTHSVERRALDGLIHVLTTSGRTDALLQDLSRMRAAAPAHPLLWFVEAQTKRRLGDPEGALALTRDARASAGDHASFHFVAAEALLDLGEAKQSVDAGRRAAGTTPADDPSRTPLVRSLIATGAYEEAAAAADAALRRAPIDQVWLALGRTARRGLGHEIAPGDRAEDLVIEATPDIGSDPEGFLKELSICLASLHSSEEAPLDQTVRGGTQTTTPLDQSDHPVIVRWRNAVSDAIDHVVAHMPAGKNPTHPYFGRKTSSWHFSGMWSVRLRQQGYHVSHIHPGGWISAVYYVDVPQNLIHSAHKEGWLEFGMPPFPAPSLESAELSIAPVPGQLVLFPSYFWHRTRPFSTGSQRLTIAFDVVPDPKTGPL